MSTAQSSPKTDGWIEHIYRTLLQSYPDLEMSESQYWVSFKTRNMRTTSVHINPKINTMRVFLPFNPSYHRRLKTTPSTDSWAEKYPSIFKVEGVSDIPQAIQFINSAIQSNR